MPETIKLMTVIGARPQFVKAAAVSRAMTSPNMNGRFDERIVHTGQHYDENMSQVFFDELKIPLPWTNLGVGSGGHGAQTGKMMERLEQVAMDLEPHAILVYGDTNSTLAAALVGAKLHIPVAHVEAGLRSFNRQMPEEVNRVLTDHVSSWLFCPSDVSKTNLQKEGILENVYVSGDVMYDAILFNSVLARESSQVLDQLNIAGANYVVATIHRAENTDNRQRMQEVLSGFAEINRSIILPLHPRTKKCLENLGLKLPENVVAIPPVSYLDMLQLVQNAQMVLTDSGGLQKEAYWLEKPCITMRDETEWVETVEIGWNILVGASQEKIVQAFHQFEQNDLPGRFEIYGDGHAAKKIVDRITENF